MYTSAGRYAAVFAAVMACSLTAVLLGSCGKKEVDPLVQAREAYATALRDAGIVQDAAVFRAVEAIPLHKLTEPPAGVEIYGENPVLMSPMGTVAYPVVDVAMVEAAKVKRGNKVLDVAPGTGYRAALCAHMGAQVCCVVGSPQEEQLLRAALERVGCGNVIIELGIKAQGCPKYGPFNVLFGDWSSGSIPETVMDQIKNQGRVVMLPRAQPDRIMVYKCQKTTLAPVGTIMVQDLLQRYRTARMAAGQ